MGMDPGASVAPAAVEANSVSRAKGAAMLLRNLIIVRTGADSVAGQEVLHGFPVVQFRLRAAHAMRQSRVEHHFEEAGVLLHFRHEEG